MFKGETLQANDFLNKYMASGKRGGAPLLRVSVERCNPRFMAWNGAVVNQ